MQVNDITEVEFRNWTIGLLLRVDEYPVEDWISDGAEKTGASVNAIRNYAKKMLSRMFGSLERHRLGNKGPTFVRLKAPLKRAINEEQLTPGQVASGYFGDGGEEPTD